ncbi:MAG: NUDIX hydrolase [Methyloceanibacter sp.]|uniref:NUDIX hydrolase n=1 Tax=Methyloceanibacter sp. TaxID=1965321 RepID=UPI003D6C7272
MNPPLKQVAALPYVETADGLLVLLITTRRMGRWTIPKGWPKPGLPDTELAAREALEEAGIRGDIGPRPIAQFLYTKRLHLFSWSKCTVDVYPLRARCQALDWREKSSRRLLWIEPDEAAGRVGERGLARILLELDPAKLA